MKHFLLIALVALGMSASAQNTRANQNATSYVYSDADTLTNAATVTHTLNIDLDYPFSVQINPAADSLSGSTDFQGYIEHKAKGSTKWCQATATAIDGEGGLTYLAQKFEFNNGSVRVRYVGNGTQSTKCWTDFIVFRKTL